MLNIVSLNHQGVLSVAIPVHITNNQSFSLFSCLPSRKSRFANSVLATPKSNSYIDLRKILSCEEKKTIKMPVPRVSVLRPEIFVKLLDGLHEILPDIQMLLDAPTIGNIDKVATETLKLWDAWSVFHRFFNYQDFPTRYHSILNDQLSRYMFLMITIRDYALDLRDHIPLRRDRLSCLKAVYFVLRAEIQGHF